MRTQNSLALNWSSYEIADVLSPNDIIIDARATDKTRLLRHLSAQAASELGLDPDEVSTLIAEREELGSTGVGNGVALPRARLQSLKAPFALLARLSYGIDFEAIDGEPVDIVVLLLIPEGGDSAKGNALACVARAMRDPETRQRVRTVADREALFRAIAESGTA